MTAHRPHRLPGRIAVVMAGTILVFALTLGASVLWLARALDRQARTDSVRLLDAALSTLGSEMLAVTLEYAKWDDLALAVEKRDDAWLYRNMGVTAATGQMTDLVILWGGELGQDRGWLDQSPEAGLSRLVSPATLALADRHLTESIPIGASVGVRFFVWRGSDLFAAGLARVEWTFDRTRAQSDDARIPRLLMGRRITLAEVEAIAAKTLLSDLRISRAAPKDRPMAALPGPDGVPVAWLSWEAPKPGSALLGRMLPILLPVTALAIGLGFAGVALSRRDARSLVQAQAAASAAAYTDSLTGLANRAAFTRALAEPSRRDERAVLFLDVNGFKRINDSLGHAAGDEVVVRLARRLETLAGPDCLLARIGGDEFVFLVTGSNAGFRVEWLAQAAERALASPLLVAGHRLRVQAAMGHAAQGDDALTGEELVRQADLAMYEAKRRAGGPVAFGQIMDAAGRDARAVERHLREAIGRPGELWIAYQPILTASGCALTRVEALARWTSPELGAVPPDSFVAVAERAGLIVELGRRLLHLVCDDLAAHPALRVSVNVSPLQLVAPDFVPDLLAMLRARGIDPARIEVELTEGVLVDDPELASRRVRELHEAGVATALDDFGTGFSSIGTLRQVPFRTLKIDRSFVAGLDRAPETLELLDAMILLGHALGLHVVCEGVESMAQVGTLQALGCDFVQGAGIEEPLPLGTLAARWLDEAEAAVA